MRCISIHDGTISEFTVEAYAGTVTARTRAFQQPTRGEYVYWYGANAHQQFLGRQAATWKSSSYPDAAKGLARDLHCSYVHPAELPDWIANARASAEAEIAANANLPEEDLNWNGMTNDMPY